MTTKTTRTKKADSFNDVLINKIDEIKETVNKGIYTQWANNTNQKQREDLYSKACVLDDMIFQLKQAVRGDQ